MQTTPLDHPTLLPYDMIRQAAKCTIGSTEYIIAIYGAYNSYGLIGSEHNGIVVLDNTRRHVVLDAHCPQSSGYFGASRSQTEEFARICSLSEKQFVEWVNAHPRTREEITVSGKRPKPPKPMVPLPKFTADQFTATQFTTAEDKAKFANHFAKFVARGFRLEDFPEWFYRQLSNCFHHIAHYNRQGFYGTWFGDLAKQVRFIDSTIETSVYGDPKFTFSDVERVLQKWLLDSGIAEIIEQKRNEGNNWSLDSMDTILKGLKWNN